MFEDSNSAHFWAKNITGYLGTAMLIILYIPQVVLVYRKREAESLSLGFLCLAFITAIDMTIYGFLIEEWPVIVANIFIFICVSALLIGKCLFKK